MPAMLDEIDAHLPQPRRWRSAMALRGLGSSPRSVKRRGLSVTFIAAAAAPFITAAALGRDVAPANTLADLSRQFSACMASRPLARSGSQMTIAFAMRRDGSVFGKPRITYSRLEGDAEARRHFVASVEQAAASCLPLKVTPALGAAIAGRIFTITFGTGDPRA